MIDKLNAAVNKLIQKPEFLSRLDGIGAQPNGGTPEQLHKRMADEMEKWQAVIKRAGLGVN